MPSPQNGSVQSLRQPSVLTVLPSSHCSLASLMPSPQNGSVQSLRQPSVLTVLPSSHCSLASLMPSPQNGSVQSLRQPSVLTVLPSSHCSLASLMPSPQNGSAQSFRQPSVLTVLPSSHCSLASLMPSPHTVQSARHVRPLAPAGEPGGSQVSLFCASTISSPQRGIVQLLRQESLLLPLPSSHSSPASRCPSPQTVQFERHWLPFPPAAEPGGSQVSPGTLTIPSPQNRT